LVETVLKTDETEVYFYKKQLFESFLPSKFHKKHAFSKQILLHANVSNNLHAAVSPARCTKTGR
jgi:hypothetical protein